MLFACPAVYHLRSEQVHSKGNLRSFPLQLSHISYHQLAPTVAPNTWARTSRAVAAQTLKELSWVFNMF